MIMKNHMEYSIYASIPEIENEKVFLDVISKKYTKFSKNEKNELFSNHLVNVCFEFNVINTSSDNLWLHSCALIQACNYEQTMTPAQTNEMQVHKHLIFFNFHPSS